MGQTPAATVNSSASQSTLAQQVATPPEKLMRLDYEGFTVWLDCEKRGAVKFQYNAQHDNDPATLNRTQIL
jgi:endonuclease G